MESKFIPSQAESEIYNFWETKGFFRAHIDKTKEPFSIVIPPPNANGFLHLGHAMFVYEDAMIRYQKLKGKQTFWLYGTDHAGIETQFVFEKQLKKQGKSRFDFDRETLFKMMWDFVMENRGTIKNQLKRLGFALDWSRENFTMDKEIVNTVYDTFQKLFDEKLLYRAKKLVNYCTRCGTSYSDLEVKYVDRIDPLYYMKYGPFELATTRPETKFGDTGIAVNPKDKRYKQWIGKEVEAEGLLGRFKIKVVGDEAVDPKFGTGVVKVTPAHDFTDYEIGQRHDLKMKQVIGFNGRLNELTGPYQGLKVMEARKKIAEDLQAKGLLIKIKEDYAHRVGTCYRCGTVIEPLPLEQWFISIKPLAKQAINLIKEEKIKVYPKRFTRILINLLDNFIDWNISRQIVWGIRIPAYQCQSTKEWFVSAKEPDKCQLCGTCKFEQDSDTFDTWFSSAQWPYATLLNQGQDFYDYFYPTSVLETGYDILRAWVSRMIMIGQFKTQTIPFKHIFLHGMVRDKFGQKMSKSKGNVINPLEMVDKHGADALRASLIFGIKEGNDTSLSEEKIIGMRNFANKIWNIGRFIEMNSKIDNNNAKKTTKDENKLIKDMEKEYISLNKKYFKAMDSYKFSIALGLLYEFLWHRLADYYVEQLKEPLRNGNIEVLESLKKVYSDCLVMLHPFMPFVTEAVYQEFHGKNSSILSLSFSSL